MTNWILGTRGGLVLTLVVQALYAIGVCLLVWIAIGLARREETSRQVRARQECIVSGGAWQEGRIGVFRTESCVRPR